MHLLLSRYSRSSVPATGHVPPAKPATLLCVANFPANTGFAWNFIESLYAGVAGRLAPDGVRTLVCYPEIREPPESLKTSPAGAIEHDFQLDSLSGIRAALRLIREENVRTLYLTDRPAWSPVYPLLRGAGVSRIVVHDHTSGRRTIPTGLKRPLKIASRRIPGTIADVTVAVSEYVGRRKREVDLLPPASIRVVPNSVPLGAPPPQSDLRTLFQIPSQRPIIVSASRATPEKGIDRLLLALDSLWGDLAGPKPVFVYMGDGPFLPHLKRLASELRPAGSVIFAGYREDAFGLLGTADIAVVPSIWEEAFGLAALEPMVWGVPVIASRIGGLPEVIADGATGLLVPPGDVDALARALQHLLEDPAARRILGKQAAEHAKGFDLETEIRALTGILRHPSSKATHP